MPTYEYRCENGHTFEVVQRMADDPITTCEVCGAPVERVFHPVAVHFKGSGFYTTDYGSKPAADSASSSDGEKSGSSDSGSKDSGSDSKESKKQDSGEKSKTGSSSD